MSTLFHAGVVEGQTLTGDQTLSCDVCIVGSGAGGAVAAATLQAAGLRVVVLEEGGYFTKERFRMLESETFTRLYQDGGTRVTKDLGISLYQGRAVGGGTVVNWTTSFRTPADVVHHWARHHHVKGFVHDELGPHWDAVEKRLSISKVPVEALNRNNKLLFDGCQALGYEVDTLHRNVLGCAHTGYCGMGCPIDAKQSMLVTYLPDAMKRGATVVSRCRVDRLVFDGDEVAALKATLLDGMGANPTGATLEVKAKRYILSAGAIGTPSILLRSGAPDASGKTGKRTFLHPVVVSAAIFPEPVNAWYGAPQSAASHHFAHRGDDVGYFLEAAPIHPALAATVFPGHGKSHRDQLKYLPFVAGHLAITIDGFHDDVPGGSIELTRTGRPVVNYPIAAKTWEAYRDAHRKLVKLQLEMGARRVITGHEPMKMIKTEKDLDGLDYAVGKVWSGSAHQMGGAMMSDDKKHGVVRSEDLRHHGVTNLHVIDGSVFPTSLGVNPQESIYGLSSLISSRLAAAWT